MCNEKINLCVNTYKVVIEEKTPFYNAINDIIYSSAFDKKEKANMVSIVGSAIRHHLFYKKVLYRYFKIESSDTFYNLATTLTDLYFTRRYKKEELYLNLENYIKEHEPAFDAKKFEEYFEQNTPSQILSNEMKSATSNNYLSIRFNVPEWIVNMWHKQYSRSICIKTIAALSSKQKQYVKINQFLDFNHLVLPSDEFVQSKVEPDIYEYISKQQVRHNELILKNRIYVTNEIENDLIKKIKLNFVNNVVFYFYEKNNFHIDLMNAFNENSTLGFFTDDFQKASKALEYIKKYKTDKIYYDQAETDQLAPRILNSANLFVLFPKSSNLNYVNSSPDYLLNFDSHELDRIIIKEKEDLLNCSKYVLMGGYLAYFTHTMNKKENSEVIKDFLENNKNFQFVCEKEYLLSNKYSIFGYYAILTRVY